MARSRSAESPSRSSAPDRMFVTSTSALSISSAMAAAPSSVFRSRMTLRLLRWVSSTMALKPVVPPTMSFGVDGASTRITSAPWSASIRAAIGPIKIVVRSTTRTPVNAPRFAVMVASPGAALTWRKVFEELCARL